ncbi:GHKL domain-containing protein [Ruminococcaceae bacterium OttesenSCG-928-D13]|nr:GHKL domain-containing protein [Ruminococcaceae bacterium OttesenSCG-928-D13]
MRDATLAFTSNMLNFATAVCLCFVVVREKLRRPIWEAIMLGIGYVAVYCAACALLPYYWGNVLLPVFLLGAFLLYKVLVDLPGTKLLFVLMMEVSLCCFIVGLAVALKIDHGSPLAPFFFLVTELLTLPLFYYILRGLLWPMIRDLNSSDWRYLWGVPLTFSVLELVLVYALKGVEMWLHVTILLVSVIAAVATYFMMFIVLRKAVEFTRETERNAAFEVYRVLQGEQYDRIAESITATRAARHDLRHQLLVLKGYLADEKIDDAKQFCDDMTEAIPTLEDRRVCANFAVNAVAVHYLTKAEAAEIAVELQLGIPENLGLVQDRDMCILVGNLLENAVEACRRMETGSRYIRMSTRTHHNNLFITMANSHKGDLRRKDGVFYSTKRAGEGIGLSSVRAVAQKYRGDVEYSATPGEFRSVAYVNLGEISLLE